MTDYISSNGNTVVVNRPPVTSHLPASVSRMALQAKSGVTRVNDPADEPQTIRTPPPNVSGAVISDADGVRHRPFASSAKATLPESSDPLDSARSQRGGALVHRSALSESDLVTVRGCEMTVAGALQAGFIQRTPNGYEVTQAKASPQRPAQAQSESARGEAFTDEIEGVAADLAASTSGEAQAQAIRDYVQTGEISRAAIERIANERGVHPAQAQRMVESLLDGFQRQAEATLSRFGAPDEVMAWAEKNASRELADALSKHATQRSTSGYQAIGRAYIESLGDTREGQELILSGSLAPGMKAELVNGEVVLSHPNWMPMTYREAVRNKLIAPNFGGGAA